MKFNVSANQTVNDDRKDRHQLDNFVQSIAMSQYIAAAEAPLFITGKLTEISTGFAKVVIVRSAHGTAVNDDVV